MNFWLALLLAVHPVISGQDTASPGSAVPGSELVVYVMTMGPGDEIWERFGHIGIGVRDASTGVDSLYDYGRFSFSEPGFLVHFLQGRMRYWMAGQEAISYAEYYQRADRSVYVQELNLTPAQRLETRKFLRWNQRPENKYYRYDYYRDNCATRIRDLLDRVLGGAIRRQTDTMATGTTYRSHTQRLTSADVPMYTGITMGMGHAVDQPISAWEEMFLPFAVREHLRSVTVPGPDGTMVPLVAAEHTLFESDTFQVRAEPPHWVLTYLGAGVVLGGLALLLGWMGSTRGWAGTAFAMLGTLWYLVLGLGGIVLLGLWGFTDHWVTYRNENVMQFNLFALPLVVLLPLALRRGGKSARMARRVAALVAAVSLGGLLLKVLPVFYQVNLETIALILPVNLAFAAAIALATQRRPEPAVIL
ncbi:MAG: DUF4105 domain-containing protein [Gemmatimonadota bacterium]